MVKLADPSKTAPFIGEIITPLQIKGEYINNVCLYALKSLAADVIIGEDVLKKFSTVAFNFGGPKPALNLNAITSFSNEVAPIISQFLTKDCRPIAVKPRPYSKDDRIFMQNEKHRLIREGKIQKSNSA
jgi:hypothetical protein